MRVGHISNMNKQTRILVLGRSGSGKSTFARQAAATLGVPVIHLDRLYWQPGWVEGDEAAFFAKVEAAAAQESWVMDGNYHSTWPITLPRTTAIVFLDLPRWRSLWGVAKRIATSYGRVRPDSAPGCPERIDFEFLRYVWTWDRERRPSVKRVINNRPAGCALYMVTHHNDIPSIISVIADGNLVDPDPQPH